MPPEDRHFADEDGNPKPIPHIGHAFKALPKDLTGSTFAWVRVPVELDIGPIIEMKHDDLALNPRQGRNGRCGPCGSASDRVHDHMPRVETADRTGGAKGDSRPIVGRK